jgi:hypothetical protein
VTDGGSPSQREPGDHGKDRRESDGRDEAEKERAACRRGEVDSGHVRSADKVSHLVVGSIHTDLKVAGIIHQERDRAEADDEGENVEIGDQAGSIEY